MADYLPMALTAEILALAYLATKKNNALTLFLALGFGTLYVGQDLFLATWLPGHRIKILNEYGYGETARALTEVYLLIILSSLIVTQIVLKRISTNPLPSKQRTAGHNIRHIAILLASIGVYTMIIGLAGYLHDRPNEAKGGTFGTILIMCAGMLPLRNIGRNRVGATTYVLIAATLTLLMLSGSRILVIYYALTLTFTAARRRQIQVNSKALLLGPVCSFAILIAGQALKEYTGRNVELTSYYNAIIFTLGKFYVAQTEAFVSSASTLQFLMDHHSVMPNGGITILNGLYLSLPSTLKSFFPVHFSDYATYTFSIIPSSVSFFLQGFLFFGVLLHSFSLILLLLYYQILQNGRRHLSDFHETYAFFLIASTSVLLVRGGMDLILFNCISVGLIFGILDATTRFVLRKSGVRRVKSSHGGLW